MDELFPATANGAAAEGGGFDGAEMDLDDGDAEAIAAAEIQQCLKESLVKFASKDFIMEPEIFSQLKKYFQAQIIILRSHDKIYLE